MICFFVVWIVLFVYVVMVRYFLWVVFLKGMWIFVRESFFLDKILINWRVGELKGNLKLKYYNKVCLKFLFCVNINMVLKGLV